MRAVDSNLGHDEIATAIEMLLSHEQLALQDPEVVIGALAHYRRKPALGLSDCLILEIARKAGHLPLGAFDKSLKQTRRSRAAVSARRFKESWAIEAKATAELDPLARHGPGVA